MGHQAPCDLCIVSAQEPLVRPTMGSPRLLVGHLRLVPKKPLRRGAAGIIPKQMPRAAARVHLHRGNEDLRPALHCLQMPLPRAGPQGWAVRIAATRIRPVRLPHTKKQPRITGREANAQKPTLALPRPAAKDHNRTAPRAAHGPIAPATHADTGVAGGTRHCRQNHKLGGATSGWTRRPAEPALAGATNPCGCLHNFKRRTRAAPLIVSIMRYSLAVLRSRVPALRVGGASPHACSPTSVAPAHVPRTGYLAGALQVLCPARPLFCGCGQAPSA